MMLRSAFLPTSLGAVPMAALRTRIPHNHGVEQNLREQEVRRAKKELDSYFKGMRTEREARAALKIIKAFVRDREHTDPAKRRPLNVVPPIRTNAKKRVRTKASPIKTGRRRQPNRQAGDKTSPTSDAAGIASDSQRPASAADTEV